MQIYQGPDKNVGALKFFNFLLKGQVYVQDTLFQLFMSPEKTERSNSVEPFTIQFPPRVGARAGSVAKVTIFPLT